MGEAKTKQALRAAFLMGNPICCYCGAASTEIDHCPPRSVFSERKWPETFEFPCCAPCNRLNQQDEQIVAVLFRVQLSEPPSKLEKQEFTKLLNGVRNNRPDVLAEWQPLGSSATRRHYRDAFGYKIGTQFRTEGYGVLEVGRLSTAATSRFMVKLAQALYYRHCGTVLHGEVMVGWVKPTQVLSNPNSLTVLLKDTPLYESPSRATKSLADQFHYRYNFNREIGALTCVVQFSEQMVFQLLALRQSVADEIRASLSSSNNLFAMSVPHRLSVAEGIDDI